MRRIILAQIVLYLILYVFVFSFNVNASESSKVIKNVPFIKQEDQFCGPAALESLLRFYGTPVDQREIAKEVYTPKLRGALITDMEYFARKMRYKTDIRNGSIDELVSFIDSGVPLIVLVDLGNAVISVPHYYVVYGYDKKRRLFFIHTGNKGNQEIGFDRLDSEWKRMNRLMLVIRR
jgi:ABC-type bacteriocin/lantibiotic exporter with double-glycine peptidase domain